MSSPVQGPPLEAEALTLAYDQLVVARDLSVQIPRASFTVIIGPNGCGKSTLLPLIAGLLRPDGGQVTIGGDPGGPPRAGDGRVGIAFQQPRLLP